MNELNWRLLAWPVTGGDPRIIPRGQTYTSGVDGRGLRARLSRDDCIELTFTAVGAGLNVGPLTPLQLQYDDDGTWVPLFFGEVRVGGNTRDWDGQDVTVRGMSRTFEEVLLPDGFAQPQQAAHLTLRAAVQAIVASGQWGTPSLVLYDPAAIPDLGFDYAEVKDGNQQNLAGLIDAVKEAGAGFNIDVWVGVRPDRTFFARVASTTVRDVTGEVIGEPTWNAPVAEAPWTAALWYLGKTPKGRLLTHRSVGPDAATYRPRTKRLTPGQDVVVWAPAPGTWTWTTFSSAAGKHVPASPQPSPPSTSLLTDSAQDTASPAVTQALPAAIGGLLFETTQPGRRVTFTARATSTGPSGNVEVDLAVMVLDATGVITRDSVLRRFDGGWASGTFTLETPQQRFLIANVLAPSDATGVTLEFTEFRVEMIDADLLDSLARYHYAPPSAQPADITTGVFVPPSQLPGRVKLFHPDFPTPYEDGLDGVEYRLTDDDLVMGWLTGQADDPEALAQAELIRKRDGDAVITAVTAPT